MIRLTKKLLFAIEAVLDIAYNGGAVPVRSVEITEREGIPRRYLEPVLQELVREGILRGIRGPSGGYRPARGRRRLRPRALRRPRRPPANGAGPPSHPGRPPRRPPVGTVGIIDHDRVDLTNLQRQIVHATGSVGALKVDSARATLAAVNDGIRIETHPRRLDADNAAELIAGYDLVADGSDNFATRYLLTEQCFRLKKPLVAAPLSPFEGHLSTFRPYLGHGHPSYRCLFREPPPPNTVPRCEVPRTLCPLPGAIA